MGNGRIFEMDVENFKKLYKILKSVQQVADNLGYGFDAVRAYMKRNNIPLKYKSTYSCNENFFAEETEAAFYWAGFIAADGNVYEKGKNKPFVLKIGLATKDYDHLENFRNCLNSDSPIKQYKHKKITGSKYNRKDGTPYNRKETESCELVIYSQKLCDDLIKFGITPRKSLTLQFPEWLKTHKYVNHFIRGYVDGDGSFSFLNRNDGQYISFSVIGTEQFLTSICEIININCEFKNSNKKISKINNIYQIGYSGNKKIAKIYKFLYGNSTIFLNRKKEISCKAKEFEKKTPTRKKILDLKKRKFTNKEIADKFKYSVSQIINLSRVK